MTLMRFGVAAALLGLLGFAPSAEADWLFTPFIGANTGGESPSSETSVGVSAAWMGAGILGWEVDAAWTPGLFEGADDVVDRGTDAAASTYMFNAILGVPVGGQSGGGIRPYASGGVGAMHTEVESALGFTDRSNTAFGWNVGGGAMGFFGDRLGVRGDVRYFQNASDDLRDNPFVTDSGRFGFWRLTGGVVIRGGSR